MSDRLSKYIRVRYTGPGVNLGRYGQLLPGTVFSMTRRDWYYLEDSPGGVPPTFEKVGEADEDLPKVTPASVEAEAKPETAEVGETEKGKESPASGGSPTGTRKTGNPKPRQHKPKGA
jgi:hypothetical protein